MSSHHNRKEQKKALLKKNRHHQEIFNHLRQRRAEEERVRKEEKAKHPKPKEVSKDLEWTDKVATIRNRLTGKERVSKERWNRFAGTSGGGGRGL